MSIAPSSTAGTGPSSPLLQLPTLIRDEILGHLFPPSNNIWLVRPGASAHSWSYQLIANAAAEEHFEYYNAFWRRRQIESVHRPLFLLSFYQLTGHHANASTDKPPSPTGSPAPASAPLMSLFWTASPRPTTAPQRGAS